MECSVCFEEYLNPRVLLCGHTFCEGCILKVKKSTSIKCPECRCKHAFVSIESFPKNFSLTAVMDEKNKPEEIKEKNFENPEEKLPNPDTNNVKQKREAQDLILIHKNKPESLNNSTDKTLEKQMNFKYLNIQRNTFIMVVFYCLILCVIVKLI